MALTKEQLKKYGLSLSDASSSDHDKGIVSVGGQTYQIKGFERQQKKGTDTDKGKVFSTSLEKDSGKDFTNFNTATDVEQALEELLEPKEDNSPIKTPEPVEYSPEILEAKERVRQWEDEAWSGKQSEDIYGGTNKSVQNGHSTDNGTQQKEAADNLASMYIRSMQDEIADRLNTKIEV